MILVMLFIEGSMLALCYLYYFILAPTCTLGLVQSPNTPLSTALLWNFGAHGAAMSNRVVLYLLFMVEVFTKGLTDVIQTQQTVMAAVGEDVHLSCQLMQSRDVVQVTWQKLSPEGEKNLATYSTYSGQTVNPGFKGKVEFKDVGLQTCSIVIRKVMEQDEGCYLCLFNTYPDGSLTARTCIQLYELHEPVLQIRESNSTEETVVSCSATGRPAPTVTLNVTQQDLYFSNSSTVSVTNTNSTFTVTTTAVLSGFHGNDTQVGCVARLLSVPEIQVFKTIPAVKQSSADGFDDESGSDQNFTLIRALIVAVVVCVAVVFTVLLTCKYMNSLSHRDTKEIKMTQEPIKTPPPESRAALLNLENEKISQRTPEKKDPKEEKSSSTIKSLSNDKQPTRL